MELPDFIRTEWKDKGNIEVHFLNSDVINISSSSLSCQKDTINDYVSEPSNSFCDKDDIQNITMDPGTFSVQCSFSTLNIWEYNAKNNSNLLAFDMKLQNPIPVKVDEAKNIEEIQFTRQMESDISEGHKFLNDQNCTDLSSSDNNSFYDHLQGFECEGVQISNKIVSGREYNAKNNSNLLGFDMKLQNPIPVKVDEAKNMEEIQFTRQMESDISEGHKFLNDQKCTDLSSSDNKSFYDNLQGFECEGVQISNKITSGRNQIAVRNSSGSKDPTWRPGGVAWALNYCQEKAIASNSRLNSEDSKNNKYKSIYVTYKEKISHYVMNHVVEFFNIMCFSVYQLLSVFNWSSVIRTLYTRIFKGYVTENDKKLSLQINRCEVKALKYLKSHFGRLIKVFPRTPLLCEKYGMAVQKVKFNSEYSNINRGRSDELIRISNYQPSDIDSSQADLILEGNKYCGLYVTYLSEHDVQYLIDKQFGEKVVVNDNDILHPILTEESEYIACAAILEGKCMPYYQMVKEAVQDFKLMQFIEDPSNFVDIPLEIPKCVGNYWIQRHRLFLRYDEGICLDEESWYSVTPEIIAAHQAQRCACDVVIDAFCGAGGNAIQLAAFCNKVIAIDIDPKKIKLAQNNAKVYGVLDKIEFIVGDFVELAPNLKGDVVFMSPPWGGMAYNKGTTYDIFQLDGTINGKKVFEAASTISNDIAIFLPKSANIFQVILLAGLHGRVDLEYAHISNKRKGLTVYYGNLVDFNYDYDEEEL